MFRQRFISGAAGGSLLLGTFIPPWKQHGFDSPEEFFHGVARSRNPIERLRRDEAREEAAMETMGQEGELERVDRIQEEELQDETLQRMEEAQHKAKGFLPYGATPSRVGKSGMAAWGTYESGLQEIAQSQQQQEEGVQNEVNPSQTPPFSQQSIDLLLNDMDIKLDYKLPPSTSSSTEASSAPPWPYGGKAGFVLDIDGVIYKSKKVIEGSDLAIKHMIHHRIPFVFMTNGGGKTEKARAAELEKVLGLDPSKGEKIDPAQVIMSHTPMQLLAPHYKDDNVLILGAPSCEEVALSYGFKNAIGIHEFQRQHPELVPFKQWQNIKGLEPEKPEKPNRIPYPEFAAVFSFSDTMDAFNDAQVVLDVVTSPYGRIGTGVSGEQTVPIYYHADDLLWATEAPLPRLGGGAFREMLGHTYKCVTGADIQIVQYGKPRAIAYHFAERRLRRVSEELFGWNPEEMRLISMVGDNLDTDILGANQMGSPWLSVHVVSGIGGGAVAAHRSVPMGDLEMEWFNTGGPGGSPAVSNTPHYVAPTLDHYLRELTHFTEEQVTSNRSTSGGSAGLINPAALTDVYNLDPFGLTV